MSDAKMAPAAATDSTRISVLGWVAIAAVVVALLWSAWMTRAMLDLRERKPAIVRVQLQGLMAEYVRAQARSNAPQEQIAADTKVFLAQLNRVVTGLSKDGQIVLVNEAVVGDGVPDVTPLVRRAVYAKVAMPKVAAIGVEDRMMAYLKQEGSAGERAE